MRYVKSGSLLAGAAVLVVFSGFWLEAATAEVTITVEPEQIMTSSYHAGSLVRITFDAGALPLDFKAVESLVLSDEVGAKAVRDVLGISSGEGLESIKIEAVGEDCSGGGTDSAELKPVPNPEPDSAAGQSERQGSSGGYGGMGGYVNLAWRSSPHYSHYWPVQQVLFSSPAAAKKDLRPIECTMLIRLEVDLPPSARPVAPMLLRKVVEHLREALQRAHRNYAADIKNRLEQAEAARDKAKSQFDKAIDADNANNTTPDIGLAPADEEMYRQLDKAVDLSALTPTMPLATAIERIKNSVDPPLTVVVLWRDLYDNAEVEPTTKINMDGFAAVRLGTALDNLLKAVAGGLGEEIGYIVDNGVITIATTLSLPSTLETRVYKIPAVVRAVGSVQSLIGVIMQTIEPDSWFELNDETGEGEIMLYMDTKLSILQTREAHRQIAKLLKELGKELPVGMGPDIPLGMLADRLGELQEYRNNLNEQIKALSLQRVALANQRDSRTKKVKATVGNTLDRETEEIASALETLKRRIERGAGDGPELDQVKEILVKVRLISQNVMREIDAPYSPHNFYDPNNAESVIASRFYSKQNELSAVNYSIGQIHNLMTANRAIDQEVSQIRLAARRLLMAEGRVYELGTRLANLHAPQVAIVGAE